ncbi:MAG: hypothetical protein HY026_07775 [Deltaproteobacteria bacterium]|nr:hypothetical protein [Deltaproteobacteria bacterium]
MAESKLGKDALDQIDQYSRDRVGLSTLERLGALMFISDTPLKEKGIKTAASATLSFLIHPYPMPLDFPCQRIVV